MLEQLGLGTYPYVNARVRAMRANLLTANDYRKLEKMSFSEMAEFLQQRDYDQEFNELGAQLEGEDLLERALDHHLARVYDKLMRISPDSIQEILQAYFFRIDIENLKLVFRKQLRDPEADVEDLVTPTRYFDEHQLYTLHQETSMEAMLEEVPLPGTRDTLADRVEDPESLEAIEDALEQYYYETVIETAQRMRGQGRLFQEFLAIEADLINVKTILRMLANDFDQNKIRERLRPLPAQLGTTDYDELLSAGSYEDAVDVLRDKDIGTHIRSTDIAQVERALDRYKIEQGTLMLHQEPLSINPVLGYMISKQAEVQNLRILLQAKSGDLGEDFVEDNLIYEVKER